MGWGFLTDIFDANSKSDQQKRLARGGKRMYADDERAKGNDMPNRNIAQAVGRGVVSTPWWFLKTDIINPTKQLAGQLTGNKEAEQNAIKDQFKGAKDVKGALAQTGFRSVDLASNLLLPGSGAIVGETASTGAKIAATAGVNAAVGGTTAALDEYSRTGKIDPKNALIGAAAGGVVGGALEAAPHVYGGLKNINASTKAAIEGKAAEVSGLRPENVINQNEAGTLRDFVDHKTGSYPLSGEDLNVLHRQARHAAKTAGIDITSGSPEDVGKRVYAYLDQLNKHNQAREAITQGGYVQLPGVAEDLAKETDPNVIKKNMTGNVPEATIQKKVAAVAMTKDPVVIKRMLAEPETPKRVIPPQGHEVADAYAGELKAYDDSVKGGEMIPDGEGGYRRTTEHTPFYSEYYKEFKRPPSQAAYKEQALKELESGRAPETYQPHYDDAVNPDTQSLLAQAPEAPLTPEEQNALAAKQLSQDANQAPPPSAPRPAPSTEGEGKQRKFGFIKNVEDSPTTTPELKKAIDDGISVKTYAQKSDDPVFAQAKRFVEEDFNGALEHTKTVQNVTDEDIVLAQHVIDKLQKEGTPRALSDAVDIVEQYAEHGLGLGRAVRAFGSWDKLSEAGLLRLAEKKISKARGAIKGGSLDREAKGLAKEIQGDVEGAVKIDKTDVQDTLKNIVKDVENEELSTGQKIANKVDRAINPKVKKQADTLVAEVTKKIKEEQLAPLPKAQKRSATDILQEVFGRNKEAQDAFPEAQAILRERFADNPVALKKLDTFFESELGLPAASSTINTAIKEQLKRGDTRISDIIFKSWDDQKRSVEDITSALTKEGFEPAQAKSLADEVVGRLNQQLGTAKAKVLERYATDVPLRGQSTYLDRMTKLSNLGALDDRDYLKIARAKLDLPQLTPETAGKLSELAQKVQKLADDDPERYKAIKEIGEVIQEAAPKEKVAWWRQVPGGLRAAEASYDISGAGRQGLTVAALNPKLWFSSFKKQLKYFGNEEAFNNDMAKIAAYEYSNLEESSGLALTGVKAFGKPEEAFSGADLAETIPLLGRPVKASDRAYTGTLTDLRHGKFAIAMQSLKDAGYDPNKVPKEWIDSYSKYINTFTGRGTGKPGGWFEKHADSLAEGLFSPRLWKSRLDMLNPKFYYDLKGPARKEAIKNAAAFASLAGAVLSVAAIGGANVETDARSSDFLKIKVGDTRYDILGGFQQNLVFAWRNIVHEKKSSVTGKITDLNEGGFNAPNRFSLLADLVQNKEAPLVSGITTQLKGEDKAGNKFSAVDRLREVAKLGAPISLLGTGTAIKNEGIVGAVKSLPDYLGVGVSTYGLKDIQPTKKQKEYVADLEKHGAPKEEVQAVKEFYQTLKVGPDRKKISGDISEAIRAGDTAKAKQLADDYNKQYASNFKDWKSKYGKYASDKALLDAYAKGKIKLTKASVKSRARSSKSIYEATRGQ